MIFFLLCAAASILLCGIVKVKAPAPQLKPQSSWHTLPARASAAELVSLIRKLALLLQSGRTDLQLWQQATLNAESVQLKNVLRRAAALAALGLPSSAALETIKPLNRGNPLVQQGICELSICLQISEQGGVPLASLLENLAEHLEQKLDLEALRRTALAGPQATVTLLSWLPLGGFAGGYLMGADPLAALLAPPWGIAALVLGTVLALISRLWTSNLIHHAQRIR